MRTTLIPILIVVLIISCTDKKTAAANTKNSVDTSSSSIVLKGPNYLSSIQIKNGYPVHESVNKLYDAMAFQRACEVYLQMFPLIVRNSGDSIPPSGFLYWKKLSDIVNTEDINSQDQTLTSTLKHFGFEKGKPFNPSLQQKIILIQAADVGFRMAEAIALGIAHHGDSARIYRNTKWIQSLPINRNKVMHHDVSTEQRIASTFQQICFANDDSKKETKAEYLFSAEDKGGQWLDGGKFYQLHIPGKIPASESWSITVYDNSTYKAIQNDEPRSSFNSRQATYLPNPDGSVDVFFGSIAPAGEGTNWIRTLPNKGWFVYLRLNDASETFFEKSWPLGDIEELSKDVWYGQSNK